MKIRAGFVSNSSSSSFIIVPTKPNTITSFNLGIRMLNIRNEDWLINASNKIYNEINKIQKAISLGLNPDIPITFKTTNYDTFIRKVDDVYHVASCNNQDWSRLAENEDISIIDYSEDYSEDYNTCYWWVREGVLGRQISEEEWKAYAEEMGIDPAFGSFRCWVEDSHFGSIVRLISNNDIICADCYLKHRKPDMLLSPLLIKAKRGSYKIRPNIKLRG